MQQLGADVLVIVSSARAAGKVALKQLRKEIAKTRNRLEKLVGEERIFRLDLFGIGERGKRRPRPRKKGRSASRKAATRAVRPRRKGPPKADKFFGKLPSSFTIDDVRKVAGKAAGISLAQWARAQKIRKTAIGYQKVA
jgi:hypothetical protein